MGKFSNIKNKLNNFFNVKKYQIIINNNYRARKMYIGGLLTYSLGMMLMALTKHKVGVIFFSWTAGVMYSTLFTMPYLLVAHYHAQGVVSKEHVMKRLI